MRQSRGAHALDKSTLQHRIITMGKTDFAIGMKDDSGQAVGFGAKSVLLMGRNHKNISRRDRLPPPLRLLAGLLVGYGGLIVWQGLRLIVLVTGVITGLAIAAWSCLPSWQDPNLATLSTNLLEPDVWQRQLDEVAPLLPTPAQSRWQAAAQQTSAIHALVAHIAQQEPTFPTYSKRCIPYWNLPTRWGGPCKPLSRYRRPTTKPWPSSSYSAARLGYSKPTNTSRTA
ncbi:hypothetical protein PN498_14315 [Oscillatoria sp. CS-180]|uniref:hypothetical protein n=1 Tax=Oscillatoria sp. CS-180 TaxID=3021720 RepID=UPI0023308162|nr:hypothetical protein [Oscillatoria sp. CS-180]MDB9527172.1 hypothetical protein [Oscillatoria sp. CS-180]